MQSRSSSAREARSEQRREDVAAAVWRVLSAKGFAGLNLRAVAAELGATTGTVMHHFHTKRELVAYAFDLLAQQSVERPRREGGSGSIALRDALLDMLPLGDAAQEASRVWVSSWDAALADSAQQAAHAVRYEVSRTKIRALVEDHIALRGGDLTRAVEVVDCLHAAALGVSVQAVLDPGAFPDERLIGTVDRLLAALLERA